jgi:hypothetical protein
MLFLYRPRQTWMPYSLPRNRMEQAAYNRHLQDQFAATRRVAPPAPTAAADPVARLKELAQLHESGALTDDEFSAAKAKVLGGEQS